MREEDLNLLVTQVRKENEDLITAKMEDMFQIQYGEFDCVAGQPVLIPLAKAYDTVDIYQVLIFEALDTDGVDMRDAVSVIDRQRNSFTLLPLRDGHICWETVLKTPKINYWTDSVPLVDGVQLLKRADGGFTYILNGENPQYFNAFNYETNATGVKLFSPSGTAISTVFYAPAQWTIAGQGGFQSVEQIIAALNTIQPSEKSATISAQAFGRYEVPQAQVDGVRTLFFLPETFIKGSIHGFKDYVLILSGKQFAENELVVGSGACQSVTFFPAPEAGALIVFFYQKQIEEQP